MSARKAIQRPSLLPFNVPTMPVALTRLKGILNDRNCFSMKAAVLNSWLPNSGYWWIVLR